MSAPDKQSAVSALQDHPLAELFPLMEPADLQSLADNIRAVGLKAPITLYEGKILDGRNRFRACQIAGIEPRTKDFDAGRDALAFVLSANLHRRHLTTSQRAMVAAKIAQLPNGGDRTSAASKQNANLRSAPSIPEAARKLSVSPRLVAQAKIVLASPAKTRAVETGAKTVHAAAAEIKAAKSAKASKDAAAVTRDDTGFLIPPEALPTWERRGEVQQFLKAISGLRKPLEALQKKEDPFYSRASLQAVVASLGDAYRRLSQAVPYAVCTSCQGREGCRLCQGTRFISRHVYEGSVPEETKAIRDQECVR